MKKFAIGFTAFFILVSLHMAVSPVFAKKRLPQNSNTQKVSSRGKQVSSNVKGVTTSVKFRRDRRGVIVTFSNLAIAQQVNYSLVYTSRGIQEGAGGSLSSLEDTQTRELLFGTCSSGVCRYHPSPKNARLVITTTLKDGKRVSKSYRLKV